VAPNRHLFGAAGVIKGKLYLVSGSGSGGLSRSLDVYDPATQTWSVKKALPAELRDLVAGAVLQGKLYVAGGFGDGVGAVGTLEEYDPVTDDWVRRRSMPTPRFRAAAGARLMVIGGVDRTGQISEIVEAYVP